MLTKKVIRRSIKQSKPWIGDKTWEKIKERKEAKLKIESGRSEQPKASENGRNKEIYINKTTANEGNKK